MRPGAYAGLPLTGYVNCKLYWYNDFPLIRPLSPSLSGAEILLTLPLPLPLLLPLPLCAVPLPPLSPFPSQCCNRLFELLVLGPKAYPPLPPLPVCRRSSPTPTLNATTWLLVVSLGMHAGKPPDMVYILAACRCAAVIVFMRVQACSIPENEREDSSARTLHKCISLGYLFPSLRKWDCAPDSRPRPRTRTDDRRQDRGTRSSSTRNDVLRDRPVESSARCSLPPCMCMWN
jgi:hypothetical protein